MDVGAGINQLNPNSTADGWHNGFGLGILTRAADIRFVFFFVLKNTRNVRHFLV